MRLVWSDDPQLDALAKVKEHTDAGRNVMLVVREHWWAREVGHVLARRFKSDALELHNVGSATVFVRSAKSSMKSISIPTVVILGKIDVRARRLAAERTAGHVNPEVWQFRSIGSEDG